MGMVVRVFIPCEAVWPRWDLSVDVARFAIESLPFHFGPPPTLPVQLPGIGQLTFLCLVRIDFDPTDLGRHDLEIHAVPPQGARILVSGPHVIPTVPPDGHWRVVAPVRFTPPQPGLYRLELQVDRRPTADWPLQIVPMPLPPLLGDIPPGGSGSTPTTGSTP